MTNIDASMLTDHMMLAATEQGLGSAWICRFKSDIIKEEFHLPAGMEPIHILTIGYAEENAGRNSVKSSRMTMNEFVSFL